mmetsp:Transcript_26829/g.31669  ORF Transcript_26829/g.31669 Transcript_26829/m.31669 type:complete len:522 (-) Transcript_26829:601-2166(-)
MKIIPIRSQIALIMPKKTETSETIEAVDSGNTTGLEEIEPTVLVSDFIRLQTTSWNMVADEYGFEAPAADMIQIAGTLNPDESVRAVFRWTDDDSRGIEIALSYRRYLRELTESLEYRKSSHTKMPTLLGDDSLQTSNEDEAKSSDGVIGKSEILDIRLHGWNTAAEIHSFEQPSIEDVQLAQYSTPGDAIKNIMQWTTDEKLVDEIVASYQDACRHKSSAYTQTISVALPDDSNVLNSAAASVEKIPPPEITSSGPSMDDVIKLQHSAWTQAAEKLNFSPPTIDEVYAASFMEPKKAITSVFQWSPTVDELETVAAAYRANLKLLSSKWAKTIQKQGNESLSGSVELEESLPFFLRKEGATKWLKSLQDMHMPCVVVSYMSSEILDVILREIGLSEFFPTGKRVSSSSGYELDMQQILGGALRAERRPDKCVLFSSTPQSATSAHDVKMKNVALVRPYPYYELTTADMTALGLGTIRITNMQNIFSDANSDEPMQELQLEGPEVRTRKLVKTKFRDDDGF